MCLRGYFPNEKLEWENEIYPEGFFWMVEEFRFQLFFLWKKGPDTKGRKIDNLRGRT